MPSLKESYVKNRTQIGDPISLKAETSTTSPTPDEEGAASDSPKESSPSSSGHAAKDATKPEDSYASSSAPVAAPAPTESDTDSGSGSVKGSGKEETLRDKAEKKLHGEGANPSQLGDPVSLKAENSDHIPNDEEGGAKGKRKDSKL